MNKKKCLRLFNKKTLLYASLSSKHKKLLATGKQLIRKNSVCCLKNQESFSQSERTDRIDPRSPCSFSFAF